MCKFIRLFICLVCVKSGDSELTPLLSLMLSPFCFSGFPIFLLVELQGWSRSVLNSILTLPPNNAPVLKYVFVAIKHTLSQSISSILSNIIGSCFRKICHSWVQNHQSDKMKFTHFTKMII